MTTQQYIESCLEELAKPIIREDIGKTPLEEAIFAKLMSKKFRKLKADDEIVDIAKNAIKLAISANRPLPVNIIFGGNKLWRLEEAPEIDWAELFSLLYFLQWMKSIASVYEPGALLEYYSEDVVVEALNNVPREETDQYSDGFTEMLAWLKPYLPEGVRVNYRRYRDDYENIEDFDRELANAIEKVTKSYDGNLPPMTEAQKVATELNVRPKPGQTDDPLWREKVELIHQAVEQTETAERYFYDPKYVPACPTSYPGLIVTGSTKRSYAKFWVGVGVLEKSEGTYNQLVLTPKQLEHTDFVWENVNLPGLKGKNFHKIRVIKK